MRGSVAAGQFRPEVNHAENAKRPLRLSTKNRAPTYAVALVEALTSRDSTGSQKPSQTRLRSVATIRINVPSSSSKARPVWLALQQALGVQPGHDGDHRAVGQVHQLARAAGARVPGPGSAALPRPAARPSPRAPAPPRGAGRPGARPAAVGGHSTAPPLPNSFYSPVNVLQCPVEQRRIRL